VTLLNSRTYPDRPIVSVGAVILKNERVLLVRRATEPLKDEWSVPGGVVELGETLRVAAEREAREETGLDVAAGEVLGVFDSIFPDASGKAQFHYVLIDFLCRVTGGDLRAAGDAAEARWFTREELAALNLRPAIVEVVEKGFASVGRRET
jgi:8-oxo-dGTP diphosphatase